MEEELGWWVQSDQQRPRHRARRVKRRPTCLFLSQQSRKNKVKSTFEVSGSSVYPGTTSFGNLGVIGNLWGGAVAYQTFFGYGSCQFVGSQGGYGCTHDLTLNQIHWFNQMFIFQIQMLPYTPITESLAEFKWVSSVFFTKALKYVAKNNVTTSYGYDPVIVFRDVPTNYSTCVDTPADTDCGWMPLALSSYAMTSSENAMLAYKLALQVEKVQSGSTKSNVLWWISTRWADFEAPE